jgi:hypothetical protein
VLFTFTRLFVARFCSVNCSFLLLLSTEELFFFNYSGWLGRSVLSKNSTSVEISKRNEQFTRLFQRHVLVTVID